VLADALLRRQDLDELAELLRDDTPTLANVASERERLVLSGDEDVAQVRVDAVAENEVDDAVGPAEIDGRLGPLSRERREPFAGAAGEHDDQDLVVQHDSGVSRSECYQNLSRHKALDCLTSFRPPPYHR
jgi:hypothetical protein